jgi:hypothetical protein
MSFNQKQAAPSLLSRVISRMRRRSAEQKFDAVRKIPVKDLRELFPSIGDLCCQVHMGSALSTTMGNVSVLELAMISAISVAIRPKLIFEFGTFDGRTTLHLALNADDEARVMTMDLPIDDPMRGVVTSDIFYTQNIQVGRFFLREKVGSRIEQLFYNSMEYDHKHLRNKVDLVFVDGGHMSEVVKSDSAKALEMVRPGGVVLWHDYSPAHPGVCSPLDDLSLSLPMANLEGTSLVCYIKPE